MHNTTYSKATVDVPKNNWPILYVYLKRRTGQQAGICAGQIQNLWRQAKPNGGGEPMFL